MKHGFEWDVNPWLVNQIGHPYQGSNYYTSGRAHGLSFWEASAVAAFGSATWEFFAENNRASLNDLMNTTLGGITLGEVMHRTTWLVRDPTRTGGARRRGELIAAAIDPLSGLARALSGDMTRVSERPSSLVPSGIAMRAAAGVLWQGDTFRTARAAARPFIDVDLLYGDVRTGRSRTPFNDFALQLSAGGGSHRHADVEVESLKHVVRARAVHDVDLVIAPPFTTNALGLTYGTGWIAGWNRRHALQIHATHHVAAIGELTTTSGESIKNVVANYWTIGAAVVLR